MDFKVRAQITAAEVARRAIFRNRGLILFSGGLTLGS